MIEVGVIQGRFQVLHLKHMEYILAAKMRCKKLFIGIIDADDLHVKRSLDIDNKVIKQANPLTYFERYEMLHDALLDFGVKREEFEIIPLPINRPEYVLQYAPKDAVYYMSICNEWGEAKQKILTDLGLETEVLWRKEPKDRGTTGKIVRTLIVEDGEWGHLVPKTVYEYVVKHKLDKRMKDLASE